MIGFRELKDKMLSDLIDQYRLAGISIIPFYKLYPYPDDYCYSCKNLISCNDLFIVHDGRFLCSNELKLYLDDLNKNIEQNRSLSYLYEMNTYIKCIRESKKSNGWGPS